MSETIFAPDADVLEIMRLDLISATASKIQALCGLNTMAEVQIDNFESVKVLQHPATGSGQEVTVVTVTTADEEMHFEERFAVAVHPFEVVGHSLHDWAELEALSDQIIDLSMSKDGGVKTELTKKIRERSAFQRETAPDFIPRYVLDVDQQTELAFQLKDILQRAVSAQRTHSAQAFHDATHSD